MCTQCNVQENAHLLRGVVTNPTAGPWYGSGREQLSDRARDAQEKQMLVDSTDPTAAVPRGVACAYRCDVYLVLRLSTMAGHPGFLGGYMSFVSSWLYGNPASKQAKLLKSENGFPSSRVMSLVVYSLVSSTC